MGETRRTTRFIRLVVLCAGALLATAGCTAGDTPQRSATPTASAPTDAAVLAAAIDAYTRYSAAFDAVLASGDGDYSPLKSLTTAAYLDTLTSQDDEFTRGEWRTTGSTSFDSEELVSATSATATVRLCRDVSRVRIKEVDGTDVTPADRAERFRVAVDFVVVDTVYLVDQSERLAKDDSCE